MAQWQSTGGLSQRCPGFDFWELSNNWSQPVATYIQNHLACVLMRISYSELIKLWRHILCASISSTSMYIQLWRYSIPTFQCMWRIVGLVVVWILHIIIASFPGPAQLSVACSTEKPLSFPFFICVQGEPGNEATQPSSTALGGSSQVS